MLRDWLEATFTEEIFRLRPNVIVIIPVHWNDLSEADKTLLTKILQSIKLSVSKVQIIQALKVSVKDFEQLKPLMILSFGSKIMEANSDYTPLQSGSVICIQSQALPDLDDTNKKQLWNALKSSLLSASAG